MVAPTKKSNKKGDAGKIETIEIFPSIGIARVGDSPEEYFVGPELGGEQDLPATFKDSQGRIKRQAARFRVDGFTKDGTPTGEITSAEAQVTWTVHLANKKRRDSPSTAPFRLWPRTGANNRPRR